MAPKLPKTIVFGLLIIPGVLKATRRYFQARYITGLLLLNLLQLSSCCRVGGVQFCITYHYV